MSLPLVNSFFGVGSLKCGSKASAIIEITLSILVLIVSATMIVHNSDSRCETLCFESIYMMFSGVHLLTSTLLAVGVYWTVMKYMNIWLYFNIFTMISYPTVIVLHSAKFFKEDDMAAAFTILLPGLGLILLHFYFIIIIRSYIEEIRFEDLEDMS